MYVVGGTASKSISKDISMELRIPLANLIIKRFPDNELYVKIIDDISGDDVIIIQTTYPDENIVELFLLQDAVLEAGANKIFTVIPYFGYSRQDKKFENGESISARAIARLINTNSDIVITIDPHKNHILDFFSVPSYSCSAIDELAYYLKKKDIEMVLAPDKGALERAKYASDIIDCEFDYLDKTRIDGETVDIKPKNLQAKGKNVAMIDDIISTGGTMAKSIHELKKQDAKKVFVSCTHGLFVGDAIKKLHESGCDEIISTDSVLSDFSKVKAAPSIVRILNGLRLIN